MASRVPVIASRTRTHSTLTVQRGGAVARRWCVRVVGGADHRRDRALEGAEDLAHPDLVGRRGELVAAAGAAGRDDEAGVAEAGHQLLEVGAREVLVERDLGEARRPGPVAPPELDHEPDAVLALRAEGDGAGSVEGRARGQGWVLVGSSADDAGVPEGCRGRHGGG